MIVVADAGPIIHLSLIGRVDLLAALYGRVLVPTAVYKEVVQAGAGLPGSTELRDAPWAEVAEYSPVADLPKTLSSRLHSGEAAALRLALSRRADLVLSDDRQARTAARELGLQVIGTLGVLVEAKRQNQSLELAPLLLDLKTRGVWLSNDLIGAVLQRVGETLTE